MLVKDLIEQLQNQCLPYNHIACLLWNASDVVAVCEQHDIKGLTSKDREEILDSIHKHRNAETGINWDTIYDGIQCHIEQKEGR